VRPVIGFETFQQGELIATDGPIEIRALCDDCTIFMPATDGDRRPRRRLPHPAARLRPARRRPPPGGGDRPTGSRVSATCRDRPLVVRRRRPARRRPCRRAARHRTRRCPATVPTGPATVPAAAPAAMPPATAPTPVPTGCEPSGPPSAAPLFGDRAVDGRPSPSPARLARHAALAGHRAATRGDASRRAPPPSIGSTSTCVRRTVSRTVSSRSVTGLADLDLADDARRLADHGFLGGLANLDAAFLERRQVRLGRGPVDVAPLHLGMLLAQADRPRPASR
jgi:hypothetical protein